MRKPYGISGCEILWQTHLLSALPPFGLQAKTRRIKRNPSPDGREVVLEMSSHCLADTDVGDLAYILCQQILHLLAPTRKTQHFLGSTSEWVWKRMEETIPEDYLFPTRKESVREFSEFGTYEYPSWNEKQTKFGYSVLRRNPRPRMAHSFGNSPQCGAELMSCRSCSANVPRFEARSIPVAAALLPQAQPRELSRNLQLDQAIWCSMIFESFWIASHCHGLLSWTMVEYGWIMVEVFVKENYLEKLQVPMTFHPFSLPLGPCSLHSCCNASTLARSPASLPGWWVWSSELGWRSIHEWSIHLKPPAQWFCYLVLNFTQVSAQRANENEDW